MKDLKPLLLLASVFSSVTADFGIGTITSGQYYVTVNKTKWFTSGHTFCNLNGNTHSNITFNVDYGSSGLDKLGPWQGDRWVFKDNDTTVEFKMKTYQTDKIPAVIFTMNYVTSAKGTKATSANKTISGWPSFNILDLNQTVGYLAYSADMFGDRKKKLGIWGPDALTVRDGLDGTGPIVTFDKLGNAFLFAPLDSFMTTSYSIDRDNSTISWGTMGGVDEIPAGFTYSVIMVYSDQGVNGVFSKFGTIMRYYHDKNTERQKTDVSLNYIGYWTDNGGYYYYNTEPGKNYEQTMLDIKQDMNKTQIPYKYIQLDSWWYYKDTNEAVTKWEPRPDIFPDGLVKVGQELGLPLVLHNRYWSKDTPYAVNYKFLKGLGLSVPITTRFWDFLLQRAKTWGLIVYEQDWMYVQFMFLEVMKTNLTLATTWMDAMAKSAENNDVTIQYCMAQSRQALQSLKYTAVTQARVSDDYHLQHDQWKIGISSLFAHAVGVAPSKDTFWTTTNQPGNPFNTTEQYPALQTLVAVLSTGPVGPSDKIGYTNKDLLMKCCNSDGLILKPSKPATAINDQIIETAFNDGSGASGQVWSTYTDFGEYNKIRFGIIMVANLSKPYSITPSRASLDVEINQYPDSVIYDSKNMTKSTSFSETSPFSLPTCLLDNANYCLYYTSPVMKRGNQTIIIYGGTNKFVWMSSQRVAKLWVDDDNVAVTLRGAANENVTFAYSVNGVVNTNTHIIDAKTHCASIVIYSSTGKSPIPANFNCTNLLHTSAKHSKKAQPHQK
ncbi:uncharacterized protein LOC126811499 [Patella vulgata]|uniref:uncharacterized protein LOC126811499 n=1 Tax=Patella vulgata TaxID=6465 RepID=UPI0024A9F42E|nr:uncharacterized protein LOC126811499 [Patella vulgata]